MERQELELKLTRSEALVLHDLLNRISGGKTHITRTPRSSMFCGGECSMKQSTCTSLRTFSLSLILMYNLILIAAFWLMIICGKNTLSLSLIIVAAVFGIAGWLLAHFTVKQNEEPGSSAQQGRSWLHKAIQYSSWLVYATIAVLLIVLIV